MQSFTELKFRAAYWLVNLLDKQKEIHFMNFGFSDPKSTHDLDPTDEKNRYSIQLYKHLTDSVDLSDKDIVEIGSGRGGGLSYVARNCTAKSILGVDLDKNAVAFSNSHHNSENLSFRTGNAQQLPIADNSFDILLNVESSHRYPEMDRFLSEVNRILRKGGHFLFTDFRYDYEWKETDELFNTFKFNILNQEDITDRVVRALELNDRRNRELIKRLVPGFMQKVMLNFAGAIGSETYDYFLNRKYVYRSYVFQKAY
jgi:ubiquinone/menaquinone biosynthesis C-methylase UbiE